jgi:hypothetical protein
MGKYKDKNDRHRAHHDTKGRKTVIPVSDISGKPENHETHCARKSESTYPEQNKRMIMSEIPKRSVNYSNWALVIVTAILGILAYFQIRVFYSQLDTMRKDQRAWMKVTGKSCIPPAVNQALECGIEMVNTGKTSALHFRSNIYIELVPNGSDPTFEGNINHGDMTVGIVYPNVPQDIPVTRIIPNAYQFQPITPSEKAALDTGGAWIAVHGTVWYDDVFKIRHWVKFCLPINPNASQMSSWKCVVYNDMDDK